MGRQRNLQTQSARLFYANHDHREIVLNGEYINGVYVPSDTEEYMDKDVAWRKYKKKSILCGMAFDYAQFCSVDTANKFVSFSPDNYIGEDVFLYGNDFVRYGSWLSKNGYDFKEIDPEQHWALSEDYRFAEQYPYDYTYNQQTRQHDLSWTGWDWAEGEEFAKVTELGHITMTDSEQKGNLHPCGEARDGLFADRTWTVRIGEQYPYTYHHYIELWHITSSGFNLVYTDDYVDSGQGVNRLHPTNIYSHGGRYCGVTLWSNAQSTQGVRLWTSTDGDSWTYVDMINEAASTLVPGYVCVRYGNGNWLFYVRYSSGGQFKWILKSSTNLSSFSSLILSRYVDIPMSPYADGIHGDIEDGTGKYLRIILNNVDGTIPAELGETYYASVDSGRATGSSWGDGRFFTIEDGTMSNDPATFTTVGWETDYDSEADEDYFIFYSCNALFTANQNNFAFLKRPPEHPELQENHEIVASDDYVWTPPNNI